MFQPLEKLIEKYISGLPMQIQDTVLGSKPTNLDEAIHMAATLTDNHVRAGTLKRKGSKSNETKGSNELSKDDDVKTSSSTPSSPQKKDNKRKANHLNQVITQTTPMQSINPMNYVITQATQIPQANPMNYLLTQATPIQQANNMSYALTQATPIQQVTPLNQVNKKSYVGKFPLCNICTYHHSPTLPCRICTNCNRMGHYANDCRTPKAQVNPANIPYITAPSAPPKIRACYQCGNPNHFYNACPLKVNINNVATNQVNQANQGARGRVFNVNVYQEQENNKETNA